MFYSSASVVHSTRSSHIEFDRVFCGQYWDDLGCAGLLGDSRKNGIAVLMLGLAEGAAIRPILASGRVGNLVCVDIDPASAAACRAIYDAHFDALRFDIQVADAKSFLRTCRDKFDVIVVDLYDDKGYVEDVFDQEFHELLSDHLEYCGHIVLNAYGIPMHLQPFLGNSPQLCLLSSLQRSLGTQIGFLPYRRNATFIVGSRPIAVPGAQPNPELRLGDRLALVALRARLEHLPLAHEVADVSDVDASFTAIDREMRTRWLRLLPELSKRFPDGPVLSIPSDLRRLLVDAQKCRAFQEWAVATDDRMTPLLPILVAGEINCSTFDASWLPNWAIDHLRSGDALGRDFVDYCLAQALAVVLNGRGQCRSMLFEFRDAISLLRGRPQ